MKHMTVCVLVIAKDAKNVAHVIAVNRVELYLVYVFIVLRVAEEKVVSVNIVVMG